MSRIVIVDDEKSIRDALKFACEQASLSATVAGTVREARLLLREQPDLLVLDIGLPDGNGLDFLTELRKSSRLPVLLLTARGDELDRVLGFELGADDYVVKPFSPREVVSRIKAILRRTRSEPGAFEHDSERQQIRFFGERLNLTRYEYLLLRLFIERPGWVYSREKLMDLIWDQPEESYDRTVDTHIKTLRAKLKKIRPDLDPIETRRGTGYALREPL
ncbi:MAG: response regulator [Spirochaetales bacterium]|nr:response regulator [Spirochaetales bacterium]